MAWSTPRLWTTGEIVTASMMNTYISDDLAYLKGSAGTVSIDSGANINGAIVANGSVSGHAAGFNGNLTVTGAAGFGGGATFGGTTRTTAGQFVAPNSIGGYASRNAANSADSTMLWMDGANQTVVMAGAGEVTRWVNSGNSVQWAALSAAGFTVQSGVLTAPAGSTIANRRSLRHGAGVELIILAGAGSHVAVGGNNVSVGTVTFSEAFDGTPNFVVMNNTTTPGTATQHCQFNARGWTASGFTYDVANSNDTTSSSLTFSWLAIGQKNA